MSAEVHAGMVLRTTHAKRHSDWQARVISTYHQTHGKVAATMQADLKARIHRLTGRVIAAESIFVDGDACLATVVVDGTRFRLQQQDLIVIRACSWCGIGHFDSPAITNQAELGYALGAWQPLHTDCQSEDPPD
jgi:hypothetical protein